MASPLYRHAHQQDRKAWQRRMDAGEVVLCWRDGLPVDPRDWQLGHRDHLGLPSHPEHPLCNMRAGGRIGARITHAKRRRARLPVW